MLQQLLAMLSLVKPEQNSWRVHQWLGLGTCHWSGKNSCRNSRTALFTGCTCRKTPCQHSQPRQCKSRNGKIKSSHFQTNIFWSFQENRAILVTIDISIAQEYLHPGWKQHLFCARQNI